MTDEERRLITAFVERVAGAQQAQGAWGNGGQQRPPLPPVDPDADRLLWEMFNRYPEARYRITQTAFVQEAALVEAQNRIRQLEWEVENARRQGQAMASQAQPRGAFGGLFGGGRPAVPPPAPMPPPPQPQYPPGYNPAAMQQAQGRSGMGFLGTAATAAAGVAGGMILGNMLMNAFSGHGAHAAPFGGGGGGSWGSNPVSASWGQDGGMKDGGASPWSNTGGDGSASGGGWSQDAGAAGGGGWGQADAVPDDAGYASDASYDQGGGDGGGGGDWGGSEET